RQTQSESDEHLTEAERQTLPPFEMGELLFVQAAAEVLVGVPRVVGEEPLEILTRQIASVGFEPFPRPVGSGSDPHVKSSPVPARPLRTCPGRTRGPPACGSPSRSSALVPCHARRSGRRFPARTPLPRTD